MSQFSKASNLFYLQVFILVPIIFTLCSIYLVVAPIIQEPRLEFLYAFLFIVGGLLFYFPLVVFQLDRGCFGKECFCQLLYNNRILLRPVCSFDHHKRDCLYDVIFLIFTTCIFSIRTLLLHCARAGVLWGCSRVNVRHMWKYFYEFTRWK